MKELSKNLSNKEKETVSELSKKFIRLHAEYITIEEEMRRINNRAEDILNDLEKCREAEKIFENSLSEKYGEGNLDISGLKWCITENNTKKDFKKITKKQIKI